MGPRSCTAVMLCSILLVVAHAGRPAWRDAQTLTLASLAHHLGTSEKPSSLSASVLEPATTNAEAVAKAKALQAALTADSNGVLHNLFVAWSLRDKMQYSTLTEAAQQLATFAGSVETLVQHNSQAHQGHWRGLAQAVMGWALPNVQRFKLTVQAPALSNQAPGKLNWATLGYTTPVKDQGPLCVGAWASAAMSSIDSAVAIQFDNKPVPFSRQWALSCINGTVDAAYACQAGASCSSGCNGGYLEDVFRFASQHTVPAEWNYSYTSRLTGDTPACLPKAVALTAADAQRPAKPIYWVKNVVGTAAQSYMWFFRNGLDNLAKAVSLQPAVVFRTTRNSNLTDVDNKHDPHFISYQGGVYDGSGCKPSGEFTHVMLVVGFDATAKPPYWILQNSWGTGWGERGFIRVAMSTNAQGVCAMYLHAAWAPKMSFEAHIPMKRVGRLPPPASPSLPAPKLPPFQRPPPKVGK